MQKVMIFSGIDTAFKEINMTILSDSQMNLKNQENKPRQSSNAND